ncbi:STAS domain-containing protein [Undibacterium arcticum]|uniref:STAS domain-containing protein n=1 Tax=Undibacterium arcticum TaxID=1762892 RepID=A0ABV7F8T0_9BURK
MFKPSTTLIFANAKTALAEGLGAIASGQTQFDLAAVSAVDSAAVATLLAWQRAALARGTALVFSNLPVNLQSLAQLYGVTELLHPATRVDHVDHRHH